MKSIMNPPYEMVAIDINDSYDEVCGHGPGGGPFPLSCYQRGYGQCDRRRSGEEHSAWHAESENLPLKDFVEDLPSVPEMTTCLKAFEFFKSSNIHMAVIVDEYGSTEVSSHPRTCSRR